MIERTWDQHTDPAVVVAEAGELLRKIEEFTGSAIWLAMAKVAEDGIRLALVEFERGAKSDDYLRGRISAFRHMLGMPGQMSGALQRDIETNRGKI